MRLILLTAVIWFATWGGMAYARGDMGWYYALEFVSACAAFAIYVLTFQNPANPMYSKAKFNRAEWYRNYMKLYMRNRRAEAKSN